MNFLLPPLLFLAALGLLLSVVSHVTALMGLVPDSLDPFMTEFMGTMTIGIFVVWLPATLVARRICPERGFNFSWSIVMSGCPQWMRNTAFGLFGYATLNFFVSVSGHDGGPSNGLRTISGHWMIFYGIAFCIFYSVRKKPSLLRKVHCPAGHQVRSTDQFCPECSLPIHPNHAEQD